jgi:hypothetical protein
MFWGMIIIRPLQSLPALGAAKIVDESAVHVQAENSAELLLVDVALS